MAIIKPQILSYDITKILSILKKIIWSEANPFAKVTEPNFSTVGYPVLIGSRAAKWHVPSFREPNDWDLIATSSQSASFINKIMSNAAFKDIKLIRYPGVGLKIVGNCCELLTDDGKLSLENSIGFDIE